MSLILRLVAAHGTASLIPLLRDADEDEARVRAALQDSANTNYVALAGDTIVGATTVNWEERESEIIYFSSSPGCCKGFNACGVLPVGG